MRSASLSREEYFFCSSRGRNFRGLGLVIVVFEVFFFAVFVMLFLVVFVVFVVFVIFAIPFELLVRRLVVVEIDMVAKGGDVQSVLVGRIGFRLGDGLRGAYDFLCCGLVRFIFLFIRLVRFRKLFFVFFFDFVFFKHGAASGRVSLGFHNFADFVLLGVNKAGGERGTFFVAQLDTVFGFVGGGLCLFEGFDFFAVQIRFSGCKGFGLFARDFGGLRASSG